MQFMFYIYFTAPFSLPGDTQHDGVVNRQDVATFVRNMGRSTDASWWDGDFNNDGRVTLADLAMLQANYGRTSPSPNASAPVPAAGELVLAAIALAWLTHSACGFASTASAPNFSAVIPILRIFDEAKAREFYVDFLGFSVDWEHRFEPNCRSTCRSRAPAGAASLRALRRWLPRLHRLRPAHRHRRIAPRADREEVQIPPPGLEIAPWNAKCMEVIDPFGNRLRFSEALENS